MSKEFNLKLTDDAYDIVQKASDMFTDGNITLSFNQMIYLTKLLTDAELDGKQLAIVDKQSDKIIQRINSKSA